MFRYLLKGLGVAEEKGSDLLSYLAFDRSYTEKLVDLGRADAISQGARIRAFLAPSSA